MRRTRRRRARVVWLPTFGGTFDPESPTAPYNGIQGSLVNATGTTEDVVWDAFAVTYDFGLDPEDAAAGTNTLKDLVGGNEWSLRRIVGKFFAGARAAPPAQNEAAAAVLCALGFIVCKTYDDGSPTTDFADVNPLSVESMNDPWIWRRTWMLNPYTQVNLAGGADGLAYGPGYQNYPDNTARYGSVMDGPHIDSKVNRRIHTQERLFGVIAMRSFAPNYFGVGVPTSRIDYHLDYRLLGIIRPGSVGNRGNASR